MRKAVKDELNFALTLAVPVTASYGFFAHMYYSEEAYYSVGLWPLDLIVTASLWACMAMGMMLGTPALFMVFWYLIFPKRSGPEKPGSGRHDPPPPDDLPPYDPAPVSRDLLELFKLNQIDLSKMTKV